MTPPCSSGSTAGIDVGGTFTDLVAWNGRHLETGKVPSTPDDQSGGVINAVTPLERAPDTVIHGTTVATNALLEGRGAVTALVTTEGFEDVLAIGRQDRPSLYDSMADRPVPLAPTHVGVPRDPNPSDEVPDLGQPESIAVSLLYGYRAGARESTIAGKLAKRYPDVPISLSSEVVAEFREFERTSTTVLNAYLRPEMSRYLNRLADELERSGVTEVGVMRSSGGLMSVHDAAKLPAAALLSGPAGGVVAAARLSLDMGYDRAISFDMGGTSTDVSRIENGEPQLTYERPIAGYPCRMASVDIHTVGAGGGSIGWRDPGGSLRVGPHSAGAVPGPASYGIGGSKATVTDANVFVGRIGVLGKSLSLDIAAGRLAIAALAAELDMGAAETAGGIVTVVEETMAGAIRRVSVEEGVDPRGAVLIAFGGAGGLHAAALAKRLDMAAAVVPRYAGVFSALGLLLSPPRIDVALSIAGADELAGALDVVMGAAGDGLEAAAGTRGTISTQVDVRYIGQAHELSIQYDPGAPVESIAAGFHQLHRERNGFARPQDPVEIVTVRAVAQGRSALSWDDLPELETPTGAEPVTREITAADGTTHSATVYQSDSLGPGARVDGPAVIEDIAATTYLASEDRATVAANGALVIEW